MNPTIDCGVESSSVISTAITCGSVVLHVSIDDVVSTVDQERACAFVRYIGKPKRALWVWVLHTALLGRRMRVVVWRTRMPWSHRGILAREFSVPVWFELDFEMNVCRMMTYCGLFGSQWRYSEGSGLIAYTGAGSLYANACSKKTGSNADANLKSFILTVDKFEKE